MKRYFRDQTFAYQLLRTMGYAPFGGAEIGECLATAERIPDGDTERWYVEWRRTAQRVADLAEHTVRDHDQQSARELLIRASNYYRTAEFFLAPDDPRRLVTWEQSVATFRAATARMEPPVEPLQIPYGPTSLPGYLYRVDTSDTPRPTVIALGGFDSTGEELYFFAAAAALRRGYHCLTVEGPGQGQPLRVQHLPARSDYEVPVRAVVDFALTRPEIDGRRVALWGTSLGGYFAARAAAFEPRIGACVVHGVAYDAWDAISAGKPLLRSAGRWWPGLLDTLPARVLISHADPLVRWAIETGLWVFGAASRRDLVRIVKTYTLDGIVDTIACPTLLLHGEADHLVPVRQAVRMYAELHGPKALRLFNADEGAQEHCQVGNLSVLHHVAFDWLDSVWGRPLSRKAIAPEHRPVRSPIARGAADVSGAAMVPE